MFREVRVSFFEQLFITVAVVPIVIGIFVFMGIAQAQEAVAPTEEVSAPAPSPDPVPSDQPATAPEPQPQAETAEQGAQPTAPPPELQAELAKIVMEAEKPPEVKADEEVSTEDLTGKENITILPDNPLYVFKKFGRGLRKAFTFDQAKKAELELKYADTQLAEVQQLTEIKGDEAARTVTQVLDNVEKDMDRLAARALNFKDRKDALVDQFTDKLAERQIKHQKVYERLEEKLPDEALDKVREVKERAMDKAVEVFNKVINNQEEMAAKFTKALDAQEGSAFKNFKNLEILGALQDKMPEAAREGMERAKDNAFQRLQDTIAQLPDETRGENFKKYVEFMPGNEGRQLQLLDEFKSALIPDKLRPDFMGQLNAAKEQAFKRFEDKFKTAANREELFKPFKDGNLSDLRIVSQLKDRVSDLPEDLKQEVGKIHEDSIQKFRAKFSDDPKAMETAVQAEKLFKKFQENPDATDFKVMEDLRNRLNPEQRQFVENFEAEAGKKFAERFEKEGPQFGQFFGDPTNPQSMRVLEGLRERLPEEARKGIDRAMDAQKEQFNRHISELDDPFVLGKIQSIVGQDESLKKSLAEGKPDFFIELGKRRDEFETKFRTEAMQRFEKFQGLQQGLLGPPIEVGGEGGPPAGFDLPPEALEKFREIQEKFQKGGFGPPQGFTQPQGFTGPPGGVPPPSPLGEPIAPGGLPGQEGESAFPSRAGMKSFGAGGFKPEDFFGAPGAFSDKIRQFESEFKNKVPLGAPSGFPGAPGERPPGGPAESRGLETFPRPDSTGQFKPGEFPPGISGLEKPSPEGGGQQFDRGGKTSPFPGLSPLHERPGSGGGLPFPEPKSGTFPRSGEFPSAFPSQQKDGESGGPFFVPKSGESFPKSFEGFRPEGGGTEHGPFFAPPTGKQGESGGAAPSFPSGPAFPSSGGTGGLTPPSGGGSQFPSGGFNQPSSGGTGGFIGPSLPSSGGGGEFFSPPPSGGSGGFTQPSGDSGGYMHPPSGDSGGGSYSPPPSGDGGGGSAPPPPPPSGALPFPFLKKLLSFLF